MSEEDDNCVDTTFVELQDCEHTNKGRTILKVTIPNSVDGHYVNTSWDEIEKMWNNNFYNELRIESYSFKECLPKELKKNE